MVGWEEVHYHLHGEYYGHKLDSVGYDQNNFLCSSAWESYSLDSFCGWFIYSEILWSDMKLTSINVNSIRLRIQDCH